MAREKRQPALPAEGMAEPTIPELDEAAMEYTAIRDQRIAMNRREKAALEKLDAVLQRHNRTEYTFTSDEGDKMRVRKAAVKMKITVRKVKEDGDGEVKAETVGDDD